MLTKDAASLVIVFTQAPWIKRLWNSFKDVTSTVVDYVYTKTEIAQMKFL